MTALIMLSGAVSAETIVSVADGTGLEVADGSITATATGEAYMYVGTYVTMDAHAGIFFIPLPVLPAGNIPVGANLTLGLTYCSNSGEPWNIDLYALGVTDSPALDPASQYYLGANDTSAEKIQDDLVSPGNHPDQDIDTDEAGDEALTIWLRDQYTTNGTPNAAYAVFRLNLDAAPDSIVKSVRFKASDAAYGDTGQSQPTLTLEYALPPAPYYVDYDEGSNAANGLSAATAWKHCPGDGAATGIPAGTALAGGDRVIFKGGVHYRGTITCQWPGDKGYPITYDGNTEGTFGTGRAIIDGSDPLTGWMSCVSAADCGGNTNWQHIYKATVPANTDVFVANMYDNDEMLWPAQNPNVSDPFFPDDLDDYNPVSSANTTSTSLVDPAYLTQGDPNYYDGAYLRIWGSPNKVYITPITGYIPAENKLTFAGSYSPYTDGRTVYYAVANHILHIDVPGECSINETTHTAYIWPRNAGDPNGREISLSSRRIGIDIDGKSNLTIQGFKIQKTTAGAGEKGGAGTAIVDRSSASNIIIQNNELTKNYSQEHQGVIRMYSNGSNMLIENNFVHLNPKNRGMILTFRDSVTRNNIFHKNGGTALDYYTCYNSTIVSNTVTAHTGGHANGLTLYIGCTNCLVAYNTVYDGNVALTLQNGIDITIAYNVLHTAKNTYSAADWGRCSGLDYYNNTMLNDYGNALAKSSSTTGVTVRNNILDGYISYGDALARSHNLFTALSGQQSGSGWSPGEGEIVETDKSLVFLDPDARDFHLKNGSPAIDAGMDLGLTKDHDGRIVPIGAAPDIGAYEYPVFGTIVILK